MINPTFVLAALPLLFSTLTQAAPAALKQRDSGPSINVIFFSDTNCTTTVPPTIYTRTVYGDGSCYVYPGDNYQSLLIDEIDDQFIGTNTALEVGNTAGDTCDFTIREKFSIATKDTVGQCQFIGIASTQPGQPLKGANEYRITSLEG
jgi:hypothetical protein